MGPVAHKALIGKALRLNSQLRVIDPAGIVFGRSGLAQQFGGVGR